MTCSDRHDLRIQSADGEAHGLILDWGRGGAGLSMERQNSIQSTAVSTKGNFGVRDSADHFRIVQTDWSEGSAQPTYDREADSEAAFESSRNIDVSVPGTLRLGPKSGLSDQIVAPLPTAMLPAIIAHGKIVTTPAIYAAFTDASTAVNRACYSLDGENWYATGATGPTSSPVDFASDGETLYAALSSGAVFTIGTGGSATFSTDGSNANVTHVAFTAGYLYAAKGTTSTDAVLGAFDDTTPNPKWIQLTPTENAAINAAGTTFGLVDAGSHVYWGVTNGMVTNVMKCRYSSTAEEVVLQTVATFPTGFVGASMCSYLGTVYVGGHYDWTEPTKGTGSIYAIVGDNPVRLTDIGQRDSDNRVLAMAAYEKNLFFVSGGEIWRWDLVAGGYTHYAGPLSSVPVVSYGDIDWDGQYTLEAAPPEAEEIITGTATSLYGGASDDGNIHVRLYAINASAAIEVKFPETMDMTEDNTLEFDLPADALEATATTDVAYVGIRNGTRSAKVRMWWALTPGSAGALTAGYRCELASGDSTLMRFFIKYPEEQHTVRLTLDGNQAKVYVDDILRGWGATTSFTEEKGVYFGVDNASALARTKFYMDEIRWSTGVYDPSVSLDVTTSGVALACFRDRVVAACSGYGAVYTDPTHYAVSDEGVAPRLTFSRTSGNMPTVEKYFSAIHMTLESPLPVDENGDPLCGITALVNIDGNTSAVRADDLTGTQLVFSIPPEGAQGRTLSLQLIFSNSDEDVTPVITETSVLFDPMPKAPKTYTYFVRCWDKVQDNSGNDWDENAVVVADWLEETAGSVVTVERVGQTSYTGRIEGLSYMEAPPSGRANGREGLYQVSIRKV